MKKQILAALCALLTCCMVFAAGPAALAADACASGRTGAFAGQPACVNADGALHLCEKNFPDGLFRDYLADSFDKNGDGALSETESADVVSVGCAGLGIGDLTGLGFFTGLTALDCSDNRLTKLELSANRKLASLKCGGNAIPILDLSGNNELDSYTLSPQVTECEYNAAKNAIDVSTLIGKNKSDCITGFAAYYADGSVETVDERGGSASFPKVGVQYAEYTLNANYAGGGKPMEMTVRVYPYTDGTFASLPARTAAGRLLICEKNFPDFALRGYLRTIAAGDGHTLTDKELAAEALSFPKYGVEDLTGLGFFTGVKSLDCSGNRLTSLPAGLLKGLTALNCANNRLAALDLSGCASLRVLDCSGNRLASLDLSANKALEPASVRLGGQALEGLAVVDRNGFWSLDLAAAVGAGRLRDVSGVKASTASGADAGARYDGVSGEVRFNALPAAVTYSFHTSSPVDGIPAMEVTAPLAQGNGPDCGKGRFNGRDGYLLNGKLHLCEKNFPDETFRARMKAYDADGDGLLSVAEAETVLSLMLADGSVASLRGVEFLPALRQLSVADNRLTELDLSNNRELTALNCAGNRLTVLDLSANDKLLAASVTAGRQTGKPVAVVSSDGRYTVDLTECVGADRTARIVSVADKDLATAAYDAETGKAVFASQPASPITYTLDAGLKSGTVTMNVVCEAAASDKPDPGPVDPPVDTHTHQPVFVPEKSACEGDGVAAHYECACGKWFSDEKGEHEVSKDAMTLKGPIGHRPSESYSASVLYHWFACARPGCGKMMPGTRGNHQDADGDGRCDTCGSDAMSKGVLGDVDADGQLTPGDARLALRIAVGLEREKTPGSVAYVTADANCNDSVDPEDARLILRAAINLEKLEDYVK